MDVGYYAPAARTTLNPAVFIVFLREIDLRPATPRVYTLWARAGAFRHPAVVSSTTTQYLMVAISMSILYNLSSIGFTRYNANLVVISLNLIFSTCYLLSI